MAKDEEGRLYLPRLVTATALLFMSLAAASAQSPKRPSHIFRGTVEKVDAGTGQLTVNGEEVQGWMAAMTMGYKVDPPETLRRLKPGDRITAKVYDGNFATLYDVRVWAARAANPASVRSGAHSASGATRPDDADEDESVAYVCPMHSDYTTDKPGKCTRCGMDLVVTHPYDTRDYRLDFHTAPAIPKAGENTKLSFRISHPGTGEVVKKFEVVHDKQYHLFVISQNMEYFQHIHPVEAADGTWSVDVNLPKPGYYEVLSDFLPGGGASQFIARPLVTAGFKGDLVSESAHLVPDTAATQTVGDLTATVEYDPKPSLAGQYCHLIFHLTDAKTHQPVKDLQTYLAAFGHMMIMSEDMVNYIHSHPIDVLPPDANLDTLRGGPDVTFEGLMPKPGLYRAWTQFRYHDKILTFTNTFQVFDIEERAPK